MSTDGKATRTKSTFRMEYAVGIQIAAPPEKVWGILTNAQAFPKWNSTVEEIDGKIALGEQIKLKAKIAPGRVFKLKVAEFAPSERLVWKDGMAPMFTGVRTYTLAKRNDGSTEFSMVEDFRGVMLPMIAGSLPDFTAPFEQFASDLKRAAEAS